MEVIITIHHLTENAWKGIEENPPSLKPEKKGTKGASPKTKARNLLDIVTSTFNATLLY